MQAIVFVTVGALADLGATRKRLMFVCSTAGATLTILVVLVTNDTWWLGGLFFIATNVLYGLSYVSYNAFLPLIAANVKVRRRGARAGRATSLSAFCGHPWDLLRA